MSTYVAYYWKQTQTGLNQPCVRYIGRGFACTASELPREMKIRCGAKDIPEWEWVGSKRTADILIQNAVERGFKHEV